MFSPEDKKYSLDEIKARLTRPLATPQEINKFFSKKRLEGLTSLLAHPTIVELDMLANEGQFKDDTLVEYCSLLPEWRSLKREFISRLDELYSFLKQFLPAGVKKTFDPFTVNFHPDTILELYGAVARLCNSFVIEEKGVIAPYRTHLQVALLNHLFSRLTYDLIEEVKKLPTEIEVSKGQFRSAAPIIQSRYDILIKHLTDCNKNIFPFGLPGYAEQGSIEKIKYCLNKHSGKFDKLISLAGKVNPQEVESTYELILDLLKEIDFDDFVVEIAGVRIRFSNVTKNFPPAFRGDFGFKFTTMFDPKESIVDKDKIEIIENSNIRGLHFDVSDDHHDLVIDYPTGEIAFGTQLPYSLLLKDQEKLLKYKSVIFGLLLDHLLNLQHEKSKDNNLEIDQIQEEVTTELNSKVLENLVDVPEETDHETKKVKCSYRNRKGNRVLRALSKILGRPVRCEGTSHFIFKGKAGNTYPIAIHGDKDVGVGLLKKCLENYDISYEEFDLAY